MMQKWGVEDRVGMARERFKEFVERGNICRGFVAIVNFLLLEEGLVMQAVGLGSTSSTGQMVFNKSTISSSLLAAGDQEPANCTYVLRLDMGGVDIHIINLMAEPADG
jgi:hypothetical protein